MKIALSQLLIILLCISCNKYNNIYKGDKIQIDPSFILTKEYSVPIKNGKITIVTKGADTLAITDVEVNINIPKEATIKSRGDNDINVEYIVKKSMKYIV